MADNNWINEIVAQAQREVKTWPQWLRGPAPTPTPTDTAPITEPQVEWGRACKIELE